MAIKNLTKKEWLVITGAVASSQMQYDEMIEGAGSAEKRYFRDSISALDSALTKIQQLAPEEK